MKQIYHFDHTPPPELTSKMLQAEIERRKIRRQTTVLAISGVLAELCLLITALILQPVNAVLSAVCFAYTCIAISGGGIIAIVFIHKRRNFLWQ